MTLKSIELIGFKSFGKKSVVSFTTPITSVVGPNGSGKSNIVEAIRFVLGEQSIKSLRGKGGTDLIFKGSRGAAALSRAQVIITFDNSKKIFSFTNTDWRGGKPINIDFDEISISREVFSDGVNKYSINGTEVRLKDIIDLLSSVNIGSSGHHIISQGEADRILSASNKERRGMIEDALGLKIYQYRIKESERKLEKTGENMKEVNALKRELAPHLNFLKKQVAIIEKTKELRDDLREMYKTYVSSLYTHIKRETEEITHLKRVNTEKLLFVNEKISSIEKTKQNNNFESVYSEQIKQEEDKLNSYRIKKDELNLALGRIEGILEGFERQFAKIENSKEKVISHSNWLSFAKDIESEIDNILNIKELSRVVDALSSIKSRIVHFYSNDQEVDSLNNRENNKEYKDLKDSHSKLLAEKNEIEEKQSLVKLQIDSLKEKERRDMQAYQESEKVLYDMIRERGDANTEAQAISFREEKLVGIKNSFETEMVEATTLVGREVLSFREILVEGNIDMNAIDELKRKIERIKIKIEDSGTSNGSDVMKEYEETKQRDEFLSHELVDLENGINSIRLLISDLKENLDKEFKDGIDKINKQFQDFFALMFGGGGAFLAITMEHKKPKKDEEIEDEEIEIEETEEEGFERGIEINVSLPQKKVKDLHMLSGGERSLTSIALLFAISQVNPPPFLVLDETDAALDEANSRKYGDMLENLSRSSQLIVVTHNRETMSRAQVLYGVTMGAEGVSKLLSIRLEDATSYAK